MPDQKEQLEDFLQFIRDRRSDEGYFGELSNKLDEVIATINSSGAGNADFVELLREVKEKQGDAFKQAKENGGTAWPEFENYITQLERATVNRIKEEA